MFDNKFTTEVEALAEITAGKVESCATALTERFHDAVDSGITDLNLAAEKAVVLHAHLDHGAGLDVPEEFPFTQDAEAEDQLAKTLLEVNPDGRAEERVDLTVGLFRRYREWGVNIFFAGTAAYSQAQLQWQKDNPPPDLDEGQFLAMIEAVPDEDIANLIRSVYDDERKMGKNVRNSAISAVQTARIAAQLGAMLGGKGLDLGGLIGGIGS